MLVPGSCAAVEPHHNGNYGRPQQSRCLEPTQIEWSTSPKMKSRKSDTGKRNGPCLDAVKQIRDVDGGLMFWRRRDIENQAEDWMTRVGLELLPPQALAIVTHWRPAPRLPFGPCVLLQGTYRIPHAEYSPGCLPHTFEGWATTCFVPHASLDPVSHSRSLQAPDWRGPAQSGRDLNVSAGRFQISGKRWALGCRSACSF